MASEHRSPLAAVMALAASLAACLLAADLSLAAPKAVPGGIEFTYKGPSAAAVAWAGDFNAWSSAANPMKKGADGVWSILIALPAGEHAYKFVVDGQWIADPENGVTTGEFGNSVVKVGADGALLKQAATSNTAYSPKITIDGRVHSLTYVAFNPTLSRYEIDLPTFDVDLGFGIRVSDLLRASVLTNINPQQEDVQDYRSRLNFKRGWMEFSQPGMNLFGFFSDTLADWKDPARLVGNIGVYNHPFGFERSGFQLTAGKRWLQGQLLYADNTAVGGTEFPGGAAFEEFVIDRGTNRRFIFEADAVSKAWQQLRTERRDSVTFALVPDQFSKVTTMDVGDNGVSFGYGDGATDIFAASLRHEMPGGLRLGVLGRADRGYHLGRLVLAQTTSDSTGVLFHGQAEQQWFAAGADVRMPLRKGSWIGAEYLQGTRRLNMMDRGTRVDFVAHGISGTGPTSITGTESTPLGQHFDIDESTRFLANGSWSMAENDIVLSAGIEWQSHTYPSWAMPPVAPAGLANADHPRFENVDFQRATYVNNADLENEMLEWRVKWDRNWRYYLGREVRTSIEFEMTDFTYDPRTTWEYQMWFPTGNMWLQQNGHLVSVDRLTLLGNDKAVRVRPSLSVPIRRSRNIEFGWQGNYTGVEVSLRPRYAENLFLFGLDLTKSLRLTNDTRWVKYDAPDLSLNRGYVSNFAELVYRFADGIHFGLGWGVSPTVMDPVTNEFARIGREEYLSDLHANGWTAEYDWLSLAPQLSAAEKALQNVRRLHLEAVVHF